MSTDWDNRSGYIYAAVGHRRVDQKYDRSGQIKIGFTTSPNARVNALGGTLLAATPGTLADEEALHARFASYRVKGEWYVPSEEILTWIGDHRTDYTVVDVQRPKPSYLASARRSRKPASVNAI